MTTPGQTRRRVHDALRSPSVAAPNVGGQAVLEGVMMRSPNSLAVAVRKADGRIAVREDSWHSIWKKLPWLKKPFLRGGVVLAEALHNGMSALRWSAEQVAEDEEEKSGEKPPSDLAMTGTMIFSIALAFGLFIGVPHLVGLLLGKVFGISWMDGQSVGFHMVAGVVKVIVFLTYLSLISRMKEIKRVFEYHGAEHKAIFAFENGEELTVENARKYPRFHPRCGTSFIFIVILTSILVFSIAFAFVPPLVDNKVLNQLLIIVLKLPLLFPIAGLAYEAQRFSAKRCDNPLVRPLIWPGLMLQRITTQEPDDAQLEVGLAALRKALWRERVATESGEAVKESTCTIYASYSEIDPTPASG